MTCSKKAMALFMLSLLLWGARAFGAEQGAISVARSVRVKMDESTEKLNTAMTSPDLKAIARPKKSAPTSTSLPAGSQPGKNASGGASNAVDAPPPGRVVLSGDPLEPLVSVSHVGFSLDRICAMADHVGYGLVLRPRYRPSVLDAPYSYFLMKGRRRIATLFFDRSLKLVSVE